MREKIAIYRCNLCGNIVSLIKDGGGELICCGQPMEELVANTVDAAKEKHVPVYEKKDGKLHVKVGSVPHPMLEEHFIEWIMVRTPDMIMRAILKPGDAPEADFMFDGNDFEVYEYCNLHGLWKG
ncbi:MAG: desulfoferrodoxin [Christensenellaceae bacterium]|jgi:superoxide reductase